MRTPAATTDQHHRGGRRRGLYMWNRRERVEAVEYVTQPVARGDLRVTVTATGNLAPTNQVQVGSELSGIVKSVDVDYDQRVTVGQVLAQLDATKLEAQNLSTCASSSITSIKTGRSVESSTKLAV